MNDLIVATIKAFKDLEVEKLNNNFLTLQQCKLRQSRTKATRTRTSLLGMLPDRLPSPIRSFNKKYACYLTIKISKQSFFSGTQIVFDLEFFSGTKRYEFSKWKFSRPLKPSHM